MRLASFPVLKFYEVSWLLKEKSFPFPYFSSCFVFLHLQPRQGTTLLGLINSLHEGYKGVKSGKPGMSLKSYVKTQQVKHECCMGEGSAPALCVRCPLPINSDEFPDCNAV